jgi:hypothetical protein
MNDPDGGWIFLSHSTKDWKQVRRIRNYLEEKGHRPLAFFLKCLTDHSELDGLIRREIEARTWFLLCDSPNARQSRWVRAEVEMIKNMEIKYHETINLNDDTEIQLGRIDLLCKRATVFISSLHSDHQLADRMRDALIEHGYSVWSMDSPAVGVDLRQAIADGIDRAVARGFVLLLLSRDSAQSRFVMYEIQYALDKASKSAHAANIIPIMIDDPAATMAAMPSAIASYLSGIQWADFSKGDFDSNMKRLLSGMMSRPMS